MNHGTHSAVLTIRAKKVLKNTVIGDSIAVNGICLTVTEIIRDGFKAGVMHETLNRSSLSQLKKGAEVNLERAMPADGRFGGHMVAGHVDCGGVISNICKDDTAVWYTVQMQESLLRYVVEKGSIAIDGVSLTVAKVTGKSFSVSVIPHTAKHNVFKNRSIGDCVNLEVDMVGKYIEKLLMPASNGQKQSVITKDFLARYGF